MHCTYPHILLTFYLFSLLNLNQPIGAYFSDISGSIARNSIRDSFQRCIVLTDVKGMTVSDNIAHNTVGHCYALATGSETGNSFLRNLGAVTMNMPIGKLMSMTDTDTSAATFYSASPANTWTGNIAAGSDSYGMWFELQDSVRGVASKYYPFISPSTASIQSFSGNGLHFLRAIIAASFRFFFLVRYKWGLFSTRVQRQSISSSSYSSFPITRSASDIVLTYEYKPK